MSGKVEWRSVVGAFAGQPYEVSSLGWVRRSDSKAAALVNRTDKGYVRVAIAGKYVYVHKLVCEAFHGLRPDGHECNHINGVKSDNSAENLEWVTNGANIEHSCDSGLHPAGVPAETIREIRDKAAKGWTKRDIAESTGVSLRHIYRIVNRQQRKLVTP